MSFVVAAASRPAPAAGAEVGSSGLGPSHKPAVAAVVVSVDVVSVVGASKPATAASRPASVAEAEVGSNGLGPLRTPATAAVVASFVFALVALRRAASPAQRAVAAAAASSLFTFSSSVD
jgi:hypothetical protein